MDATQAEATALRNEEHEAYLKASSDYKESATAVANAMQVHPHQGLWFYPSERERCA